MSTTTQSSRESGYVTSIAGELWYEQTLAPRTSCKQSIPLVCVHGGPGFTSYYLEPLTALSQDLPVVLYDQAGCGRARRSGGRKDFSVRGFVEELEALRYHLGVESMHLLGHSYGGLIIAEYALAFPQRVGRLILVSASLDIPRWNADAQRLISKLPLMPRMILREGERSEVLTSPQYLGALQLYYNRFVYGFSDQYLPQKPDCLERAEQNCDAETYQKVWGVSEVVVNGLVKSYSITPRLCELTQPTICLCGREDEATPEAHEHFASQIPGARSVVFEHSAHHPLLSEEVEFLKVVREFLV